MWSRDALLEFASRELGDHSRAYLAETPEAIEAIQQRGRAGTSLEDSVLGVVFEGISDRPSMGHEFFEHLLQFAASRGHRLMSPSIRSICETGDLVNSAIADIWSDCSKLDFRSRGQMLSFLVRKMRWKASGHRRSERYQSERAERGAGGDAGTLDVADSTIDPAKEVVRQELHRNLLASIQRLDERERRALALRTQGWTLESIGAELGLSRTGAGYLLDKVLGRLRATS